jgi:hypothetical protein
MFGLRTPELILVLFIFIFLVVALDRVQANRQTQNRSANLQRLGIYVLVILVSAILWNVAAR